MITSCIRVGTQGRSVDALPPLVQLAHDDVLGDGGRGVARKVQRRRGELVLVQLPVEQVLDIGGLPGARCAHEKEGLATLHEQVHEVVILGRLGRRNDELACVNVPEKSKSSTENA